MSLLEERCGWGRGGTPCPGCSASEMFPLAGVPVLMPKGPGDVVLLGASPSCRTAWWCQSNRLRLNSHKLSLPCLFRFLPVVHKAQEELKQPKPPAQPRLKLPACAPQPSVTVRPRDLPALRHISGSGPGQERQQELPAVQPSCPAQARGD